MFKLEQNYPFPFNPITQTSYTLKKDGLTTLEVFNMLGQKVMSVVNEFNSAGSYSATVDESRLSSATYVYVIRSGGFKGAKRMKLLK